tara:strand:+ start:442 stop:618 length:177 start_codon:yes stop_codon:yes gene_type:complete
MKHTNKKIKPEEILEDFGRDTFYYEYLLILDGESKLQLNYQNMIVAYVDTHPEKFKNI